MAMMTGLIAFAANVDLEGLETATVQRLAMGSELLFEQVHFFKLLVVQLPDAREFDADRDESRDIARQAWRALHRNDNRG